MSEVMWRKESNARALLRLLPEKFSRRKLRLFVCECVRYVLPRPLEIEATNTLAFAERIADDEANVDADEWVVLWQELNERRNTIGDDGNAGLLILTVGEDVYEEAHWALETFTDMRVDYLIPTGFLRDIFGNPFRPVDFAPWRTDTAVALARQMYESREFGAMPILADALQDAGCDNDEVLSHCRGAGPHVRGCWVVDHVLGKGEA